MVGEPDSAGQKTSSQSFGDSHQGKLREHNEDAFFADDKLGLYVVADGMSGHNAPPSSAPRSAAPRSAAPRSAAPRSAAPRSAAPRSVGQPSLAQRASAQRAAGGAAATMPATISERSGGAHAAQLAVEVVRRRITDQQPLIDEVRAGLKSAEQLEPLVRNAVMDACGEVFVRACHQRELGGMGATLTLLLVVGNHAVAAHVGHCRLYLARNGALSQLSTDHTLSAELGRARSPFRADNNVKDEHTSNVLSRIIGMQPTVAVDTLMLEVVPGDRFLLCSDGYSRYLNNTQALVQQLSDSRPNAAVKRLIEAANLAGGEDNITCVVVGVDSKDPDMQRSSAILERYNTLSSVFLFEDLGLQLLARVVSHSKLPRHQQGDVVVAQGDVCDSLIVVLEGEYELLRDEQRVGTLTIGQHAGATLLFHPRPARASLRACGDARVLRLPAAELKRLLRERPWLGMGLLQRLGARLSGDLDRSYEQREGISSGADDGEQF